MTRLLSITRWPKARVALLLLAVATLGAPAASPKRVLILNPFGRDVAPFSTVVSAFRATLARGFREPVDIYEVSLDFARFAAAEGEGLLVACLEGRIKGQSVDLVVPIVTAGAQVAARHRERLFPNTPIQVVASAPQILPPGLLRTNATQMTHKPSLSGTVEDILQMLLENATVPAHVLVDSKLASSAVRGLAGIIAVSSTEEVPPGSPSALKP